MVYVPFLAGQEATADLLGSALIEETMAWTPFTSLGTFAAGFTPASNTPEMRKLIFLGQERWEYKGRISVGAGSLPANTDTVAFTFDAAHRPTAEHGWQLTAGSTLFYGVRTTLQTSGQLRFGVPTAAGSGANGVMLDGLYIDDPR